MSDQNIRSISAHQPQVPPLLPQLYPPAVLPPQPIPSSNAPSQDNVPPVNVSRRERRGRNTTAAQMLNRRQEKEDARR